MNRSFYNINIEYKMNVLVNKTKLDNEYIIISNIIDNTVYPVNLKCRDYMLSEMNLTHEDVSSLNTTV